MARISVILPESLKRKMERVDVDWSVFVRQAIQHRLKLEDKRYVAEALALNESLRRKAPKGWDSTRVVRYWRSRGK